MQRLSRRRALFALYVVSLLGCAAVAGLWFRGAVFHYLDGGSITGGKRAIFASSFNNTITIACSVNRTQSIDDRLNVGIEHGEHVEPAWWADRERRFRTQVEWWHSGLLGAQLSIGHPDKFYQHNGRWIPVRLDVPHWMLLIAGSLLAFWIKRRHDRALRCERAAAGLCPNCGYDLRATPGECPECGEAQLSWRACLARVFSGVRFSTIKSGGSRVTGPALAC